MNTHSGKSRFKNFRILMDSGSSSTIVIGKLTSKLKSKETVENTWETLARKFTTSKKVYVDFFLPEFLTTKIVTWKCDVDKSTIGRYDMILGRDLLTALGLDLKFSENVIHGGYGPYKGCSEPMVDVYNYTFK